jgi:hypothetical protein
VLLTILFQRSMIMLSAIAFVVGYIGLFYITTIVRD